MIKKRFYNAIVLILFFLAGASLNAQEKVLILPGKGVGELALGMKMKQVQKLLGKPLEKVKQEQEKNAYESSGYTPGDFIVFRNGFEVCWTYGNNKADYPVFKVYFKDKKVCYIVLSGVDFGAVRASIFTTQGNVGFNSRKEDMKKEFGEPGRFVSMANYEGEFIYENKGISFVVEKDGRLISLDIYPAK
jgi:hypothetical protein